LIEISLKNVLFDKGVVLPEPASGKIVFSVSGHAGSGVKGEDVVCAAVSALAQTLVLSVGKIAGIGGSLEHGSGVLRMEIDSGSLTERQNTALGILLESFLIGAGEIMKQHPSSVRIDCDKE